MITGNCIKQVRTDLGMEPFAFAAVIGVSVSTLYRWEALKRHRLSMDPMQRVLAERLLTGTFSKAPSEERRALGEAVVAGLQRGGPLGGLLVLLKYVVP